MAMVLHTATSVGHTITCEQLNGLGRVLEKQVFFAGLLTFNSSPFCVCFLLPFRAWGWGLIIINYIFSAVVLDAHKKVSSKLKKIGSVR